MALLFGERNYNPLKITKMMKKKATELPILRKKVFGDDVDISTLSLKDCLTEYIGKTIITVKGDNSTLVVSRISLRARAFAGRKFWQKVGTTVLTYKDKKLIGGISLEGLSVLKEALQKMQEAPRWCDSLLLRYKTLLKEFIQGKIETPEELLDFLNKRLFKKSFSIESLLGYYQKDLITPFISLWDFLYYTKNPEESIRLYTSYPPERRNLISDMLTYCKYENSKIDLKWSERRLRDEHQRQIERDMLSEASKKSDKPIYPAFEKNGISLINNERDCLINSYKMHNCTYRCYWGQVKSKNYLLAVGKWNGEMFNMGIYTRSFDIDQIKFTRNNNVPQELDTYLHNWVKENKEALTKHLLYEEEN